MSATREPEHKTIGFDPVKWIDRLRHVNETSSFMLDQRVLIEQKLVELQQALQKL